MRDVVVDHPERALLRQSDGAEHEGLLHGWAANPNCADDGWRGLLRLTR